MSRPGSSAKLLRQVFARKRFHILSWQEYYRHDYEVNPDTTKQYKDYVDRKVVEETRLNNVLFAR